MSEKENGHSEPTSPQRVAADALVSIILLAGTFVAETLKEIIPKGVPLIVTVILTVIEVTMAIYFLAVLARAVGYAFREVEEVRKSVEGTSSWQVSKRSLGAARSLLRESVPNAKDFARALKFGLRFVSVLSITAVAVLIAVDFAPGNSSPANKDTMQTHFTPVQEATPGDPQHTDEGVRGTSDASVDSVKSAPVAALAAKQPREQPGAERSEKTSREELLHQLKEVQAQIAALEKQQSDLMKSLLGDEAAASSRMFYLYDHRSSVIAYGASPDDYYAYTDPNDSAAVRIPKWTYSYKKPSDFGFRGVAPKDYFSYKSPLDFGTQSHISQKFDPNLSAERLNNLSNTYSAKEVLPSVSAITLPAVVGPRPAAAVINNLAGGVQKYRWHVTVGALAAAFLTLLTSLFLQLRRKPAGRV